MTTLKTTRNNEDHVPCEIRVRDKDCWGAGMPEYVAQWLEASATEIRENFAKYDNNFVLRLIIPSFTIERKDNTE